MRCGWRRVFSRASMPVRPWKRASGRPISPLSGRTSVGASSAKPKIISTRADAEHGRGGAGGARVAEQAVEQQRDADRLDDARRPRSGAGAGAPPPGVTLSRIAATGSIRVARRAGTKPETTVATIPTTRPTMIVRGSSTVLGGAEVDPERRQQRRAGRARAARPQAMPEQRRQHADHERLGEHRAQHLAARGAERAQQRELLRALGDRDGEGVEDQEAADEQRDGGEHEQRRADEAERVREVAAPASRPAPCRCGRRTPCPSSRGDRGLELLRRGAARRRPPRCRRSRRGR